MAGDEWPSTPLGELCDSERGITYGIVKVGDFVPGGVPVVRGGDIRGGRIDCDDSKRVTEEISNQFRRTILKGGEIVLNLIADPGHSAIVPRELAGHNVSRDVAVIPLDGSADVRFVDFFLKSKIAVDWLTARLQGSVTQKINLGTLRELPVPTPPLAKQKAIAAVLGALDDKIELNRRMNATLEATARALFQSWFVDFDPVRAKLDGRKPDGLDKATAALFPEHLEESTVGKKPLNWEVDTLERMLAVLETGGRPKGGVSGITGGIPSIGAESIVSVGRFDFGKTKFVPVEFYEGMNKGHLESHDVLIYKDGGRPGEYEPHVSLFGDGFPFEKCCINEHVYRLRANERMSQEYLYFWLTSELALAEMRTKGTGVAIPGLNSTALRSLAVLVPPRPIVEAYTRQAAPLITRLLANARQSRTLATLRDTLLPKLLSGKLMAPGAHGPTEETT